MAKHFYMKFDIGDWMKDAAVGRCTPATRGIWIDLLCAMHESGRTGELSGTRDQIARLGRCSAAELAHALTDIQITRAADVTTRNGNVTITNRRMSREHEMRVKAAERQRRHRGKEEDPGGGDGSVTPHSKSHSNNHNYINPDRSAPSGAPSGANISKNPTSALPRSDGRRSGFSKDSIVTEGTLRDLAALRRWYDHDARRPDPMIVDGSEHIWHEVQAAAVKALSAKDVRDRVAFFKWIVKGRRWSYLRVADEEIAAKLRAKKSRSDSAAIAGFLDQIFKTPG